MRTPPPSPRKVFTESARQDINVPIAPTPALNLGREMPGVHAGGFIPPTARSGHLYQYLYSMTLRVPDRSFNAFVGLTGPPHP